MCKIRKQEQEAISCRIVFIYRSLEIDPADIKAVGITNQRETTIVWDKTTGQPLYNAIGEFLILQDQLLKLVRFICFAKFPQHMILMESSIYLSISFADQSENFLKGIKQQVIHLFQSLFLVFMIQLLFIQQFLVKNFKNSIPVPLGWRSLSLLSHPIVPVCYTSCNSLLWSACHKSVCSCL